LVGSPADARAESAVVALRIPDERSSGLATIDGDPVAAVVAAGRCTSSASFRPGVGQASHRAVCVVACDAEIPAVTPRLPTAADSRRMVWPFMVRGAVE
jgi:hypothetical protein